MSLASLSDPLRPGDEAAALSTPMPVANRPGLAAITYRIGTQPAFRQTLLGRMGSVSALRTREDQDFTIGLLDAFATMADVLTFYQERIANEAFLRTATERRSLLELTRLIDYEPRQGVAASTHLAFVLEEAPGAPEHAAQPMRICAGLKVQSLPNPGEMPQTFETVAQIEARPEWNAMRPLRSQPQPLLADMQSVTLKGNAADIRPGDSLLILADRNEVKRVVKVTPDVAGGVTKIDLAADPPDPPPFVPVQFDPGIFFIDRFRLTGFAVANVVLNRSWRQHDLYAMARVQNWHIPSLKRNIVQQIAHRSFPAETGVFSFGQRAAVFGHNAAKGETDNRTLAQLNQPMGARQVDLDRTYPGIIAGSWIVLETPSARKICRIENNAELSLSGFGISAKVTRLRVDDDSGFGELKVRETSLIAESHQRILADLPVLEPVKGDRVTLDQVYFGLKTGQAVILTGQRADLEGVTGSEIMELADILFNAGLTVLVFRQALASSYVRSSVTLNANVVLATHGESVREVLGSGNPAVPYQKLMLRQQPLTHVSSDAPSGAKSTLELRVNQLAWREVPGFFGNGPQDRVFVTQHEEDGKTSVMFGDGVNGARPPAGAENILADYRRGMGMAGNVEASRLSLMPARPMGVRSVSNPLAAGGAADAEQREEIRRNAPLTILTLDRIVSLQDYEDFARAFAGISKALATWTWSGQAQGVFLTIAGPDGEELDSDSQVYANLLSAIRNAGDPHVPLRVQSYRKAFFRLAAVVRLQPDVQKDIVLAAVEARLSDAFSFASRRFGQQVTLSETMALIQSVDGVLAVEIDQLVRSDGRPANLVTGNLIAATPQAGTDAVPLAAELLMLDPRPVNLTGVSA